MQNLLSNTLLSDDLVDKTDFDLGLGFDNLQLNYDSNSTEPLSNQLTVVSLEDPVFDQQELLPAKKFLLSDSKESDDGVFKKPSNDFLSANELKSKKKSDLSNTSGQNSEASKVKRSFKRSKMVNRSNQDIILSKSAPVGKHLKNRTINATSFSNQHFFKLMSSKNSKQTKKSHKKSSSIESSDASQTSLKSDKDTFPKNRTGVQKREEFDLGIKELSISDLHSSEDDSYHQDLNKKNKKYFFFLIIFIKRIPKILSKNLNIFLF